MEKIQLTIDSGSLEQMLIQEIQSMPSACALTVRRVIDSLMRADSEQSRSIKIRPSGFNYVHGSLILTVPKTFLAKKEVLVGLIRARSIGVLRSLDELSF
jgi:hypothetical protein